jgi:hypothetical protein
MEIAHVGGLHLVGSGAGVLGNHLIAQLVKPLKMR